jgi:hypothetical protein
MQTQEYIYLNSIYSIFDSETKYHKFNLNKPIIAHGNTIQIRVSEAEIPISYYNVIAGVNDSVFFKVTYTGNNEINYDITIPEKNYDADQMEQFLNTALTLLDSDDITLRIAYDEQTLKYTLTASYEGANPTTILKIEVVSSTANRTLGITDGLSTGDVNQTTATLKFLNSANLNRTKNIFLFMKETFDTDNTNNDSNQGHTILGKIQASQLFGDIVSYQNEADAFISLPSQVTYLDHINIKLVDDIWTYLDFQRLNFGISLIVQYTPKKDIIKTENINTLEHMINMVEDELCDETII